MFPTVGIWLLTSVPLIPCPFAMLTALVWFLCMVKIEIFHYQWLNVNIFEILKDLNSLKRKIFLVADLNRQITLLTLTSRDWVENKVISKQLQFLKHKFDRIKYTPPQTLRTSFHLQGNNKKTPETLITGFKSSNMWLMTVNVSLNITGLVPVKLQLCMQALS